MTAVDTNNILAVKRRAKHASAVQFTGKNGAELVAFAKESGASEARNGGSYVTIHNVNGAAVSYRARKGDWVVADADGSVIVLNQENFDLLFAIKG